MRRSIVSVEQAETSPPVYDWSCSITACAAATRAIGTRYGEQLT
jgi:hypothetical protein